MSLEELQSDYKAIQDKIDTMPASLTTPSELVSLLRNDIGPFMGSMVRELGELDDTVADLYANAEDILQPDTAGVFAALIVTGRVIVRELMKLKPDDARVQTGCKQWLDLAKAAEETIEEITVPEREEDEDSEDPDDPEDPEDDEDDEDDDKEDK